MPELRGRVLDYGCGAGALAARIPPDRYVGVDIDVPSLDLARAAHPLHVFHAGLDEVPGDFDTIVMLALIEHVPDPAALLGTLAGRLRPGGRVVLSTPHPRVRTLHDLGARVGVFSREAADEHERLLDRRALRAALGAAGMRLVAYRRFLAGANQLAVGVRPRVVAP